MPYRFQSAFAVGTRFGLWTVVADRYPTQSVVCRCACGTQRVTVRGNLSKGLSRSCGSRACKEQSAALKLREYAAEGARAPRGTVRRHSSSEAAIATWRGMRALDQRQGRAV